jgi:small subunit ribosomal protein S1
VVSGRVIEISGEQARVELGEGIQVMCRIAVARPADENTLAESKADLTSLSSMLKAHWKGDVGAGGFKPEAVRTGQIRSFRIAKLDPAAKKIELEWKKATSVFGDGDIRDSAKVMQPLL